jgi:hypothetical protein
VSVERATIHGAIDWAIQGAVQPAPVLGWAVLGWPVSTAFRRGGVRTRPLILLAAKHGRSSNLTIGEGQRPDDDKAEMTARSEAAPCRRNPRRASDPACPLERGFAGRDSVPGEAMDPW